MSTFRSIAAFLLLSFLLCLAPTSQAERTTQPTIQTPQAHQGCLSPQQRADLQRRFDHLNSRMMRILCKAANRASGPTEGLIDCSMLSDLRNQLELPACTEGPAKTDTLAPEPATTTPEPASR